MRKERLPREARAALLQHQPCAVPGAASLHANTHALRMPRTQREGPPCATGGRCCELLLQGPGAGGQREAGEGGAAALGAHAQAASCLQTPVAAACGLHTCDISKQCATPGKPKGKRCVRMQAPNDFYSIACRSCRTAWWRKAGGAEPATRRPTCTHRMTLRSGLPGMSSRSCEGRAYVLSRYHRTDTVYLTPGLQGPQLRVPPVAAPLLQHRATTLHVGRDIHAAGLEAGRTQAAKRSARAVRQRGCIATSKPCRSSAGRNPTGESGGGRTYDKG